MTIQFGVTLIHLQRAHFFIETNGIGVGFDHQDRATLLSTAGKGMTEQEGAQSLPHRAWQDPEMIQPPGITILFNGIEGNWLIS